VPTPWGLLMLDGSTLYSRLIVACAKVLEKQNEADAWKLLFIALDLTKEQPGKVLELICPFGWPGIFNNNATP
jgi:hypothetical protein